MIPRVVKEPSVPRKHGLYRMEAILEALGIPERRLKSIHIAGTNGKGSTAAMVTVLGKKPMDCSRVRSLLPHMDRVRNGFS